MTSLHPIYMEKSSREGRKQQVPNNPKKKEAAAEDRSRWRRVVCGLWFAGSNKLQENEMF